MKCFDCPQKDASLVPWDSLSPSGGHGSVHSVPWQRVDSGVDWRVVWRSEAPLSRGGGGGERGNATSKSTGRSGRQNAATRRNMRRDERGTVQGPVKEQQPDGMSHTGGPERGLLVLPAPMAVYPNGQGPAPTLCQSPHDTRTAHSPWAHSSSCSDSVHD